MAAALPFVAMGLQVFQGFQQSRAEEAAAKAQAQNLEAQAAANRYNAEIARQNAEITKGQTQAALEKQDRERRIRLGSARASAGASGIGQESFGDILQSSATQEELDLLTIKQEGALAERDYLTQADLLTAGAANYSSQASSTRSLGKTSKGLSILGGVSKGIQSYVGAS